MPALFPARWFRRLRAIAGAMGTHVRTLPMAAGVLCGAWAGLLAAGTPAEAVDYVVDSENHATNGGDGRLTVSGDTLTVTGNGEISLAGDGVYYEKEGITINVNEGGKISSTSSEGIHVKAGTNNTTVNISGVIYGGSNAVAFRNESDAVCGNPVITLEHAKLTGENSAIWINKSENLSLKISDYSQLTGNGKHALCVNSTRTGGYTGDNLTISDSSLTSGYNPVLELSGAYFTADIRDTVMKSNGNDWLQNAGDHTGVSVSGSTIQILNNSKSGIYNNSANNATYHFLDGTLLNASGSGSYGLYCGNGSDITMVIAGEGMRTDSIDAENRTSTKVYSPAAIIADQCGIFCGNDSKRNLLSIGKGGMIRALTGEGIYIAKDYFSINISGTLQGAKSSLTFYSGWHNVVNLMDGAVVEGAAPGETSAKGLLNDSAERAYLGNVPKIVKT